MKLKNSSKEGVNIATKHILWHNNQTYLSKNQTYPPKKKKKMQEKWFDSVFPNVFYILRQLSTQKHRPPDNQDLHIHYGDTLKQYKQTLRTKKEHHLKLIEDSI